MNYRTMGATGLQLSEIGFGAGDNAGLFVGGSLEDQCRVLGRALDLGITYVDTAAGYGATLSETNLGKALAALRARPIINTKVEVTPDQVDDVAGAVVTSIEASLKRLGVDCVDVAQIHNSPAYRRPEGWTGGPTGPWMPMLIEEYLGPKGAIEGLRRLKQAGRVRFAGIAGVGPDHPLSKAVFASGEVQLLNVPYNLLNPTAGMAKPLGLQVPLDYDRILDYAALHGAGAAIINPLGWGVLTDLATSGGPRHPQAGTNITRNADAYARSVARATQFRFLARDGRTLAQAAVQFALRHPAVTTVLGGFTAVEHVEEMVGALTAPPLSTQDLARIELAWRGNLGEPSVG